MEFILMFILFLVFFGFSSKNTDPSYRSKKSHKKSKNYRDDKKENSDSFDPAETFHLEDGLDHEMDYDGYCEECDDYHDRI